MFCAAAPLATRIAVMASTLSVFMASLPANTQDRNVPAGIWFRMRRLGAALRPWFDTRWRCPRPHHEGSRRARLRAERTLCPRPHHEAREDLSAEAASAAPFGLPDAGAGAERAAALPGAGSDGAGEAALALGLLAGASDPDPHAAVGEHMPLQIDRPAAVIDDIAVGDAHAIAVGAVAAAALGHDDDAPVA